MVMLCCVVEGNLVLRYKKDKCAASFRGHWLKSQVLLLFHTVYTREGKRRLVIATPELTSEDGSLLVTKISIRVRTLTLALPNTANCLVTQRQQLKIAQDYFGKRVQLSSQHHLGFRRVFSMWKTPVGPSVLDWPIQ